MTPTLPVKCACGWSGRRAPGNPVQCPKCGAFAAFQPDEACETCGLPAPKSNPFCFCKQPNEVKT